MGAYNKDPQADLDYGWDWSDWLTGDTITTSTWVITPDTAPTLLHDKTNNATTTTCWVGPGGTIGTIYTLTNHVVTTAGREDDRSHTITIQQR